MLRRNDNLKKFIEAQSEKNREIIMQLERSDETVINHVQLIFTI